MISKKINVLIIFGLLTSSSLSANPELLRQLVLSYLWMMYKDKIAHVAGGLATAVMGSAVVQQQQTSFRIPANPARTGLFGAKQVPLTPIAKMDQKIVQSVSKTINIPPPILKQLPATKLTTQTNVTPIPKQAVPPPAAAKVQETISTASKNKINLTPSIPAKPQPKVASSTPQLVPLALATNNQNQAIGAIPKLPIKQSTDQIKQLLASDLTKNFIRTDSNLAAISSMASSDFKRYAYIKALTDKTSAISPTSLAPAQSPAIAKGNIAIPAKRSFYLDQHLENYFKEHKTQYSSSPLKVEFGLGNVERRSFLGREDITEIQQVIESDMQNRAWHANPVNEALFNAARDSFKTASQYSRTPNVIKQQLSFFKMSLDGNRYENLHLNIRKWLMLPELFEESGDFTGCQSKNKQKRLEYYATHDIISTGYSCERIKNWTKEWIGKIFTWNFKNDLTDKINNSPYNNNLKNFIDCIENKDIVGAEYFLNLIKPTHEKLDDCGKCLTYVCMQGTHHNLVYNEHNIPRYFEKDPIWPVFKTILDQKPTGYTQQCENANIQLLLRDKIVNYLYDKMSKSEDALPAIVKNICYDISYKITNYDSVVDHLSMLCSDHPDKEIQEAFKHFFNDQVLLTIYEYPHANLYNSIQMPSSITSQKNTDLRTLFLKFMGFNPASNEEAGFIQKGITYVQEACTNTKHQDSFKKLAHSVYKPLVNSKIDPSIIKFRNFGSNI